MVYQLYSHQRKLLEEIYDKFSEGKKSIMVVSPAGSGKSVMIATLAKDFTDNKKRVLFLVHRKELIDQIEQTLDENEVNSSYVDILSIIRARNRLKKLEKPDLIITDETHHSKAKTYLQTYNHFKDIPKIGFTATPVRLSGEGFEDVYQEMVEGKSVSWLIENQYLAPYRYYSLPAIDRNKLKKQHGEFTNDSINKALSGSTIFGKVVETYLAKAENEQAILYAHSVQYSKMYATKFKEAGINAIHVDSNTASKDRDRIMQGFKNKEYQVICNVDLISEGFNVPECSTVILLRPTQSLTVFIQQAMRGMRYQKGKTATIIDHVGNYIKHGLPDTERLWSLNGEGTEEQETQVQECPDCKAIFNRWITRETEYSITKMCPICHKEFVQEKDTIDQSFQKEMDIQTDLQEITKEQEWYLQNKRIATTNHMRHIDNVYAIATIFVTRNVIAEYENKKKPYNSPVHFAIREYLKHLLKPYLVRKNYEYQLKEIEKHYGKDLRLTARYLLEYTLKIAPSYGINECV